MAAAAASAPVRLRARAAAGPPARLRPPPRRAGFVERPALLERLDGLSQGQLTLVCAPTGYGKTTLLARWAETERRRLAWVTLTWAEREPARFWALVAEALDAGPLPDALLSLETETVLVLDDFHAVAASPAEASLDELLACAPPNVHVVVSSRREPDLSLAARRAHGGLGELRDDELRFDAAETGRLLAQLGGVRVAPRELAQLTERTEGWPAGAHLAALAAAGADRPGPAVAAFSGAVREVGDYLRQEVLDAQPDESRRDFLLRTAVLERLSGPLCDALLGRTGSQALLESLALDGVFLVPVDEAGSAFRYRRTAREFLLAELDRVAPEGVAALHRRASVACERAGLVDEAVAHARAAGDDHAAAAIARRHALALVRGGRLELFDALLAGGTGAALARKRPALAAQLRRVAAAADDVPALLEASERLAALCVGLPGGPVTELARSTAAAARTVALLLAGDVEKAYAAATQPNGVASPSAAGAQAAAAGALAAGRLGLHAAAAPLARSAESLLRASGAGPGRAAALVRCAEAMVLVREGAAERAELLLAGAAESAADDSSARALALALLAGLRVPDDPEGARGALARAGAAAAGGTGAALLSDLVAEVERKLGQLARNGFASHELSPAELRVLRLLGTRLTQREIAGELYLSPNTVKTHARVIYRKLDVADRESAVRAARELNLV